MEHASLRHILAQLPFLKKLVEQEGQKSIFDYAQAHYHARE